MNTVCAVLVLGEQPQTAAHDAFEKHFRILLPSSNGCELSSNETTPDAHTDGEDDDSAFGSDNEVFLGRKRGRPPAEFEANVSPTRTRFDQGASCRWLAHNKETPAKPQQRLSLFKQPLPRKVRFKLKSTDTTTVDERAQQHQKRSLWLGSAIQDRALLNLGLGNPGDKVAVVQDQRRRASCVRGAQTDHKSALYHKNANGRAGLHKGFSGPSVSTTPAGGGGSWQTTELAWKNRMGAPYRETKNNNVNTPWPAFSGASSLPPSSSSSLSSSNHRLDRRRDGTSNASCSTKTFRRPVLTPSSPVKRKKLSVASMLRLRHRAIGSVGKKQDSLRLKQSSPRLRDAAQPSAQVKSVSQLAQYKETASATAPLLNEAKLRAEGVVAPPVPQPSEAGAVPDLSCKEVFDLDELMKPKGEVRTPICRFLLPCWPEGVEGYEEAGGWRRLGGPTKGTTFFRSS